MIWLFIIAEFAVAIAISAGPAIAAVFVGAIFIPILMVVAFVVWIVIVAARES